MMAAASPGRSVPRPTLREDVKNSNGVSLLLLLLSAAALKRATAAARAAAGVLVSVISNAERPKRAQAYSSRSSRTCHRGVCRAELG